MSNPSAPAQVIPGMYQHGRPDRQLAVAVVNQRVRCREDRHSDRMAGKAQRRGWLWYCDSMYAGGLLGGM